MRRIALVVCAAVAALVATAGTASADVDSKSKNWVAPADIDLKSGKNW